MAIEGYPTVAVVEDDLDLREIYVQLLEHNGFNVVSFADGQEALQAIARAEQPIKLIVLDYMLPGLTGAQFLEQLAEQPNIEKIAVILVSALSQETPEIIKLKSHPWVVASFNKTDVTNNRLVGFVKSYFGIE